MNYLGTFEYDIFIFLFNFMRKSSQYKPIVDKRLTRIEFLGSKKYTAIISLCTYFINVPVKKESQDENFLMKNREDLLEFHIDS